MAGLPRLITLSTGSTFFQYETGNGNLHATVRFTSNTIISENNFTLFEVVTSSRVQGMVHIKSRFNNRYLQLLHPGALYLKATAYEPEEDRAKRSCTLFRFSIYDNHVRFFHHSDNFERGVVVTHGALAVGQGSVEWSKMKRIEKTVTASTTATVPARSSTKVTLIVGQGSMDVPYSYRQRDILMDGTFESKTMHDGLFSGLNTFESQYTIGEPESLPRSARSSIGHDGIVIVPGETMDLPRMAISREVDQVEVEGEEEELVPMEELPMEEDSGEEEEEEPVPLPMSSCKL